MTNTQKFTLHTPQHTHLSQTHEIALNFGSFLLFTVYFLDRLWCLTWKSSCPTVYMVTSWGKVTWAMAWRCVSVSILTLSCSTASWMLLSSEMDTGLARKMTPCRILTFHPAPFHTVVVTFVALTESCVRTCFSRMIQTMTSSATQREKVSQLGWT